MPSLATPPPIVPLSFVRPFDHPPGHWKKQLPGKYLNLAKAGNLPALAALLDEHPEYLSKRGPHNRTLLWEATRSGKMATVAMLAEAGADLNAMACYNCETLVQISPYCAARYYRRGEIASYLQTRASPPDVFRAAFLGDRDRVARDLAADPTLLNAEDPNDALYYVPLLTFAVVGGHLDLAEFLIRRGAEVARHSAQLLWLAARAVRRDLVDLLLANGADPRAVGSGIFADVADLDLLRDLLSRGLSPNRPNDSHLPPLAYISRGDKGEHPEKALLLLDHGAAIDAAGPNGKTALHYAATAGHSKVVRLLLDRGADATLEDGAGHTALSLARAAGKSATAELLVSRGATE